MPQAKGDYRDINGDPHPGFREKVPGSTGGARIVICIRCNFEIVAATRARHARTNTCHPDRAKYLTKPVRSRPNTAHSLGFEWKSHELLEDICQRLDLPVEGSYRQLIWRLEAVEHPYGDRGLDEMKKDCQYRELKMTESIDDVRERLESTHVAYNNIPRYGLKKIIRTRNKTRSGELRMDVTGKKAELVHRLEQDDDSIVSPPSNNISNFGHQRPIYEFGARSLDFLKEDIVFGLSKSDRQLSWVIRMAVLCNDALVQRSGEIGVDGYVFCGRSSFFPNELKGFQCFFVEGVRSQEERSLWSQADLHTKIHLSSSLLRSPHIDDYNLALPISMPTIGPAQNAILSIAEDSGAPERVWPQWSSGPEDEQEDEDEDDEPQGIVIDLIADDDGLNIMTSLAREAKSRATADDAGICVVSYDEHRDWVRENLLQGKEGEDKILALLRYMKQVCDADDEDDEAGDLIPYHVARRMCNH